MLLTGADDKKRGKCHQWRRRIYKLIDEPHSSRAALFFSIGIIALIIGSSISMILETIPEITIDTDMIN